MAAHIGADAVIYQELSDLRSACAGLSPRPDQDFEDGVFSGRYITPVPPDYFQHLERLRGESRKMKVVDSAKQAIVAGVAGEREVRMATRGVEVDERGEIVPVDEVEAAEAAGANGANGVKRPSNSAADCVLSKRAREDHEHHKQHHLDGESQDISLHNLNDHP